MWVWPNDPLTDNLAEMPIELTAYDPDQGIQEAGDMWLLHKGTARLRCVLSTHPLGWELRAYAGHELARSQVCKSRREVVDTTDAWRTEAAGKGWTSFRGRFITSLTQLLIRFRVLASNPQILPRCFAIAQCDLDG